ncbi:MAG: hypothetical protein AAF266_08655 [Planctomycetota bacterium]
MRPYLIAAAAFAAGLFATSDASAQLVYVTNYAPAPAVVYPAPTVAYRPVTPVVSYSPVIAPTPVVTYSPVVAAPAPVAVVGGPVVTTRFRPILGGTVTRVRYTPRIITPLY